MTTHTANRSSWIQSVAFKRADADSPTGFLAVFLGTGIALLYGEVPSYVPGLLVAGTARRSIGLAYNRLVKGRYPYQRVEGRERVQELRALMSVGAESVS